MKKWAAISLLTLHGSLATAAIPVPPEMVLDKVMFQMSAKQWVSTKTALLTVNVNATLTSADLVKARADIMAMLNKIAPGDWHLTQFDRSQDSSGLEKLFVAAEARVPQESLTNIYQNAKNVSKPGATYTINGVEFKPSLEEVQQVKQQLRERLYQQVNQEIARINKVYTNQNYSVSNILFFEGDTPPVPMAKAYQAREMNVMALSAAAPAPTLTVSNELTMTAMVELASNRQGSNNAVATQ
ncbi:Uncharacterised protein [Legionella lansingensis]|uniref:DUF541 domain-containing protein n=1 Tax=Legionella lansingensis TaxID=45067 RepID=A0A0W0VUH0_9GAMM|nr:hypothetical protein [Legionella lansingensis]KTD23545.1 hypothetical protein Llan_0803 [Legionella lansingensis]SNV51993.1 Uncharacterised protein [Legionella lansingensis]